MSSYVVKRPFRNVGQVITAGTVLTEPAVIKHFKSRLAEGKIIVVAEQDYEATQKYFKEKHGVDIDFTSPVQKAEVAPEAKPATESTEATTTVSVSTVAYVTKTVK